MKNILKSREFWVGLSCGFSSFIILFSILGAFLSAFGVI